jgi:hypothetical protein
LRLSTFDVHLTKPKERVMTTSEAKANQLADSIDLEGTDRKYFIIGYMAGHLQGSIDQLTSSTETIKKVVG